MIFVVVVECKGSFDCFSVGWFSGIVDYYIFYYEGDYSFWGVWYAAAAFDVDDVEAAFACV